MINSQKKGKNFELHITHLLETNFSCSFHRVPMSGAMASTKHIKDWRFHGDIFTESSEFNDKFNLVIECKKYEYPISLWEWAYVIAERGCKLGDWILQAQAESEGHNFLMVLGANNRPDICIHGEWDESFKGHYINPPTLFTEWLKATKGGKQK